MSYELGIADLIIVVPTKREAAFFADYGLEAYMCGIGMAECAAATAWLLADRKPGVAILAGVAGSYTDALSVGDTVVVASETVADLGRAAREGGFTTLFQKTYAAGFIPEGLPAVDSYTVNTAGYISGTAKTMIENMEGATFFAVCERFGVAAAEIRTVSNRVGDPVTSANLDLAARRLAADLRQIIR